MKQIVPEFAQIGDDVVMHMDMIGSVAGLSAQNDCLMVKWDAVPGVDVIGIGSPVWSQFKIYRDEPEPLKCESCGGAIMADESGCPSCDRKNLNEAAFERACVEVAGSITDRLPDITITTQSDEQIREQFAIIADSVLGLKLPWSE